MLLPGPDESSSIGRGAGIILEEANPGMRTMPCPTGMARALVAQGASVVFTSGNPDSAGTDARNSTGSSESLSLIHALDACHATWMAVGWARESKRVGVVIASGGAARAGAGLADARREQIPIVCILSEQDDGVSLTESLAKRILAVSNPNEFDATLEQAFAEARTGSPGVVIVRVPFAGVPRSSAGASWNQGDANPSRTSGETTSERSASAGRGGGQRAATLRSAIPPSDAVISECTALSETVASWMRLPSRPIHPGRLAAEIATSLSEGHVLCLDAPQLEPWFSRAFAASSCHARLDVLPEASPGRGVPHAVGVKLGHPGGVLALVGEDSFALSAFELAMAARLGLALPVVVVGWESSPPGAPIALERIAEAFGGHGERVDEAGALQIHLRNALAAPAPSVIHTILGLAAPNGPGTTNHPERR